MCWCAIAGMASPVAAEPRGLDPGGRQFGDGGRGIAAVRRILETIRIRVIFVTAYPERLLIAQGIEPACVMRKPFDP